MKNRSGFILIFVLLTILTLSGLVAYLRLKGFAEVKTVKKTNLEAQLYLSLPAILQFCREKGKTLGVEANENGTEISAPFVFDCSLGEFQIRAEFYPEDQLFDLNKADLEGLRAAFEALGLPSGRAEEMAQSLLDWRDSDQEHRLEGAEKDYYEPLGYGPRNGPLKYLDEVIFVRGFGPYVFWIDPGLFRWVTIYGGKSEFEKELSFPSDPNQWQKLRMILKITYHGVTWRYLAIYDGNNLIYHRFIP